MKKKLLPFILGCAAAVTMTSLAAHAQTTEEYANEIPTGQTSPTAGDDSQNGFTEYNDTEQTENTLAKVFTDSTTTGSGLGNTRNTTATMQNSYAVTNMNEQANYRGSAYDTGLAGDIDDTNTHFADATNDTAGTTDLETSVPEFDMKIPASTVLPLGATRWRVGNVEIHGRYFVRPDKVDVVTTHADFRHSDYDDQTMSPTELQNHKITFTVADKRYVDTPIESLDRYYFQDGKHTGANHDTDTKQAVFPYAYTGYSSDRYEDGLVSEINETHQVWALSSDWTGKTPGKYTGSISFAASVVSTEDPSMYTNYYPGEGSETNPNP